MSTFVEHAKGLPQCHLCCHKGKPSCKQAKCLPHERCDNRQGYYVDDKEAK